MTTTTAAPKSTAKPACRKCGSTQLEQRADVLRREIAGIDPETGREFVAVEWLPVKCSQCGQFRRIKTYVEAKPTKRPAPPRVAKQKSAPTFAQSLERSAVVDAAIVSIPAATSAAEYSTASKRAQQSAKDTRPKRNPRRGRN